MNIKKVLIAIILYIGGVLTKTVLEDLNDFLLEKEQSLTNISFEDYAKLQDRDPCNPYIPLVPDFSKLKTLSEVKCKGYIWNAVNREKGSVCNISLGLHESRLASENYSEDDAPLTTEAPIIYGGRDAEVAEFGHMAAVGWLSKDPSKKWVFKCGSILISDKFLLTAAHCSSISPRSVTDIVNSQPEIVMMGVENITEIDNGTLQRSPKLEKIKRIIVHPNYKPPKKYNDIALLEVENPIKFNDFIRPACIWPHNDLPEFKETFSLTGWGLTESGKLSPILQVAEVEIVDTQTCDNLLKRFNNRNWNGIIDTQICAGKLSGGVDSCQGDSGGPLQIRIRANTNEQIYMIMGVTSFGIKCGVKNQPGVYTRVSSYVPWIEEIVWGQNKTL